MLAARWCLVLAVSCAASVPSLSRAVDAVETSIDGADALDPAAVEFFESKIRPVLVERCYACHSAEAASAGELQGNLLLDSRDGMRQGGDSGAAVAPGDVDASLLISAIRRESFEMPPEGEPLTAAQIADFVRWIEMGAPDPREGGAVTVAPYDMRKAREFWSFQPVRRVPAPKVDNADWPRNWIDQFVLAKLESESLSPAPPASKRTLIRRAYFDVTGLPPTPEETEAFIADPSADAYERMVDRLLESPRHGERWAQHWLDVVRFAETEGFEYDRHVPDAWRYRDYVISSLNADKPFDQFLTEQVAGDEFPNATQEQLTAAVFHRLGPVRRNAGNQDVAASRNEVLTERSDATAAAFLGLTVGCARCHNHKLDPISQRDYYCFQAFFGATEEHNVSLADPAEQSAWDATTRGIEEQIETLKKRSTKASPGERRQLDREIEDLRNSLPAPLPTIPTVANDMERRTPVHVLRRGVWENKAEAVGPRGLSVLLPDETPEFAADVARPRSRLAAWLADESHPLTARVLVNRLWQHHFGQGIVRTPNDFGSHGDPPSHPELLDALADELMSHGWRMKHLHRLILTSSTYRQSSLATSAEEAIAKDPGNRWLWRFNRRRLSAEEIRDAMLSVAGVLNEEMGGESVMLPVDRPLIDLLYDPEQWKTATDPRQHARRSIYLVAKRNLRLPFMEVFDQPPSLTSCPSRTSTTHAPQSLELLNGALSNELAKALAARLTSEGGGEPSSIVDRAFRLAMGRPPSQSERTLAIAFLAENPLSEYALAMFNLNGFLYVD